MSRADEIIKESFFLIDRDFDGAISLNELMYSLRFIGIPYDYSMDDNKNKIMYSLSDYTEIAKKYLGSKTPEEQFIDTISVLDSKNSGVMSIDKTIHLVMTMTDILSDEDLQKFKNFIDPNDKKIISMEEFSNKIFS